MSLLLLAARSIRVGSSAEKKRSTLGLLASDLNAAGTSCTCIVISLIALNQIK